MGIFRSITLLPCSLSSHILCCSAGHKNRSTPYLRHVIFLFHASSQTLGPSREHKRDDEHAPEVQGPVTDIPYGQGGPLKPSVCGSRYVSTTARVLKSHAIEAYTVFICSHFRTQGKLTTDCDGSVRHRKWSEPARTLSWLLPRT